jgi:hypothetical protein
MKLRTVWAVLSLMWVSAVALAWEEPRDFRGLPFGDDIEKLLPQCTQAMLDKNIQYIQKCWWKSAGSEIYQINGFEPLAGVKLSTVARQVNGGLEYILATFPSGSFGTVLPIMIERYGKLTAIEESEWVSKGGVRLKNTTVRWRGDNVHIELVHFSSRSDYSELSYSTKVYRDWAFQRNQDQIKGAAKGL